MGATASAAPAPIKVGSVFTEGASVGFPTTGSKTLKAFFKEYNARGGFKGRKIEVETGNDNLSVETSVALTKKMIDNGVVAFVGAESIVDCLGNGALYKQANVYSIGYGATRQCLALKQFGSVAQSIATQQALSVLYAKQNVGGKVCLIGYTVPGAEASYQRTDEILAKLKIKLAYKNDKLSSAADPTAALLEARAAGCRSVVGQLGPGQGIQALKTKVTQKLKMELFLVNGHDYKTIKGAGKAAEGAYILSYLYPFSENDSRTRAYRRFCVKYKITPDNFSAPVYASAQLFVEALKRTKGAVTRKSVGAAIAKLNVKNSFMPMPDQRFVFGGRGTGNAPNFGGYMLRVKNGKFIKAPKSQMVLPQSVRSLGGV